MPALRGSAPAADASRRERASSSAPRRWAIVRIVLGSLQMFGAAMSVVLLSRLGVSPISLTAVALTCVCTTLSVLLFGSRAGGGGA